TLQSFASVEGRLFEGGKPVSGAEITLRPIRVRSTDSPKIDDRYIARTDGDGRFVLHAVPPTKCTITAEMSGAGDDAAASSESLPLDLLPGRHVTVDLGSGGTLVRGRVVVTGTAAHDIDAARSVGYLLHKTRGIKPPVKVALKRLDWRNGWSDEFVDSPEGSAYLQTLHHYRVKLSRDGAFRISGVPMGDYELALKIYEGREISSVNPVAVEVVRFQVSEADVKRGSLDLSDVETESAPRR
ncbi:MAG: hypothetical protein ACREHD_31105, partial [Pirellulales bacterium]